MKDTPALLFCSVAGLLRVRWMLCGKAGGKVGRFVGRFVNMLVVDSGSVKAETGKSVNSEEGSTTRDFVVSLADTKGLTRWAEADFFFSAGAAVDFFLLAGGEVEFLFFAGAAVDFLFFAGAAVDFLLFAGGEPQEVSEPRSCTSSPANSA